MTADVKDADLTLRRTRRNMMAMGAIFGSVVLAKTTTAFACPPALCQSNCFLKGTKIRTAEGERKIEDLTIGDLLPTMFGGLRPIQWIGRYPIKRSDPSKPWVKDALPVRIARSALAPNVPHTDLYLTGGHSLLIDGVLVPAELLINGTTITRDEVREYDEIEFLHVKLESHDVIYAEGVPAETLINVQNLRSISPTICDDTERQQRTRHTVPRIFMFGAGVRNWCRDFAALSRLGLISAIELRCFATNSRNAGSSPLLWTLTRRLLD